MPDNGLDGAVICGNLGKGQVDLIEQISFNSNAQPTMKKILSLCAVALFACSVYAAHYPDITIKDLKAAMAQKSVTLLDANGSDSFKEGHIPGAIDYTATKDL